jgi:hypothetical protein
VQVEPMKSVLIAPGTMLLDLTHDEPLSNFAFNLDLRRYSTVKPDYAACVDIATRASLKVGWCRLTLSNPS